MHTIPTATTLASSSIALPVAGRGGGEEGGEEGRGKGTRGKGKGVQFLAIPTTKKSTKKSD